MKKYLSLVLSLILLAVSLVSCSDTDDDGGDSSNEPNSDETTPGETQEENLEIPKEDFDGENFVILTARPETYNWSVADFDELTEEPY